MKQFDLVSNHIKEMLKKTKSRPFTFTFVNCSCGFQNAEFKILNYYANSGFLKMSLFSSVFCSSTFFSAVQVSAITWSKYIIYILLYIYYILFFIYYTGFYSLNAPYTNGYLFL